MRVNVIVAAGVVGAFGMLGQDDDLAGVAVHEVHGRGATAEEAVVRVSDDQPPVAAAVRMPAVAWEGNQLDLAVGHAHAPGVVAPDAPDMLAVGVPPLVGDPLRLAQDRPRFAAAPDHPEPVGDRDGQPGNWIGMDFLGEESFVGVGRTELGVVVGAIEPVPQLEVAAIQRQRTMHVLQPDPRVDEELPPIRRAGEMRGEMGHPARSDQIWRQTVDALRGVGRLRPTPPHGRSLAPEHVAGVGVDVWGFAGELRLGEMPDLAGLKIHHRQRLFQRRRPAAAEPEKTPVGAHRVVDEVKSLLNRRDLVRQDVECDPRFRVGEGGEKIAVVEVNHEWMSFRLPFSSSLHYKSFDALNCSTTSVFIPERAEPSAEPSAAPTPAGPPPTTITSYAPMTDISRCNSYG